MIISCSWNAARGATYEDLDKLAKYLRAKRTVGWYCISLEHWPGYIRTKGIKKGIPCTERDVHIQGMWLSSQTDIKNIRADVRAKCGWNSGQESKIKEWFPRDGEDVRFAAGYPLKEIVINGELVKARLRTNLSDAELLECWQYHEDNCEEEERVLPVTFLGQFQLYIQDNLQTIIGMDRLVYWRDENREMCENFFDAGWTARSFEDVFKWFIRDYPDSCLGLNIYNLKKAYVSLVYHEVDKFFSTPYY